VPETARVPRLVTRRSAGTHFYLDALAAGHEGVMAKALAAHTKPAMLAQAG
jgi:hypothetical protein